MAVAPRPAPRASRDRRETFCVMRSSIVFMKNFSSSPGPIRPPPDGAGTDMLRPLLKAGKRNWRAGNRMTERRQLHIATQSGSGFEPDSKCSRLLVAFRVKVSIQFSNSHDNQLLSRHCERSEAIHLAV